VDGNPVKVDESAGIVVVVVEVEVREADDLKPEARSVCWSQESKNWDVSRGGRKKRWKPKFADRTMRVGWM
jgi:hypothetical protein